MKRGGRLARRTPLTARTELRRTAPMAREPIRRVAQPRTSAEASARRAVAARSGGLCEGCGNAPASDWSHRIARSRGGPWCPSNGLHLCRPCHTWAHAHHDDARQLGWFARTGAHTPTTRVWLHGRGWSLLTHDGLIAVQDRSAA